MLFENDKRHTLGFIPWVFFYFQFDKKYKSDRFIVKGRKKMFKIEVVKVKMKSEIKKKPVILEICKILMEECSYPAKVAEKIRHRGELYCYFKKLKELEVIECAKTPTNYFLNHKQGSHGKFYKLTEDGKSIIEEILKENEK